MEKKEGGVDEKGNPTVYITDVDKQYSKEICPPGKCCCHKEGKLEEHDCEPGPICTTSKEKILFSRSKYFLFYFY